MHGPTHRRTHRRTYALAAATVATATATTAALALTLAPAAIAAPRTEPAPQPTPVTSDFNGDGYADLAVGVPDATVNGKAKAGYVNLVWGGAKGVGSLRKHPGQPGHRRGPRRPRGGRPLRGVRRAGRT